MIVINMEAAPVLTGPPLDGEGWLQFGELGLALLLSACIGLERETRQKNAGRRTHTLVGSPRRCSCWCSAARTGPEAQDVKPLRVACR
jgi:uncharacterized membrane protein YhiD involved in acid resistance